MAQLKDLVVSGKTRLVGTLYADEIVGDIQGVASEATKATADDLDQTISNTYIKSLSVDGRVMTCTKGDDTTSQVTLPDPATLIDTGTSSTSGLTKLYSSTGSYTDGSMTQSAITVELGNKLDSTATALKATSDSTGQQIDTTYIKDISASGNTVTFTKGDGSTESFNTQDTTYTQATSINLGLVKIQNTTGTSTEDVMTQKAVSDELTALDNAKVDLEDAIVDLTVSGTNLTVERGDGSTFGYNTQDTTYSYATSADYGLVKMYSSSGTYEDGTMHQKAIMDAIEEAVSQGTYVTAEKARKDINDKPLTSYGASIAVNGTNLSLIDSLGSTINTVQTQDTTYTQATSADLGLVKIQSTTGTSIEDVMTQKAVSDELANTFQSANLTKDDTGVRKLTFTKGDGSTYEYDMSFAQGNSSKLGLVKVQSTTGTSTNDVMSQKATSDALDNLKTELEQTISNIFTAEIYESYEDLPAIGDSKILYLVPNTTGETTNSYDEYIWVVEDIEHPEDGYYELFGISAIDLDQYLTANQTTYAIAQATDGNVVDLSANQTTVTFTKKDGSTGSFVTKDTTYTTVSTSANGLVNKIGSGQNNASYVFTGSGWSNVASVGYATKSASATTATNAGTATYANSAGTAAYGTNAGTATYANSAGTATVDGSGNNIDEAYISATVSGRKITLTKSNGNTTTFNTQDNNTTYGNFTAPTASAVGTAGLVMAPAANTMNYVLTASGWKAKNNNAASADYATKAASATSATSATSDTAGNNISSYIANAAVSAKVITFTKGDGSTFSITTQDTNTTYANVSTAAAGLVPKPTTAYNGYVLTCNGTQSAWSKTAGSVAYAANAGTATKDSSGNNISSYISDASVSGRVVTFTKGDGSTFSITTQDNNTWRYVTTANNGVVQAFTANQASYILVSNGDSAVWANNVGSVAYATGAGSATSATKDASNNTISGYIKNAAVATAASGQAASFTFTKGDNTSVKFNLTTYIQATVTSASTVAGAPGLVPAPGTAQRTVAYVLTPTGWSNAASVRYASTANYANSAGTATKDAAGKNISSYIASASVSGKVVTFTKGDSSTFSITTQDTTYGNVSTAAAGLVPKPTTAYNGYVLTCNGTQSAWSKTAGSVAYAANAGTATKDAAGKNISSYIANAAVSAKVITFTKGDGSTFSITTQDTNTTYANVSTAAAGLVPKPTTAYNGYVLTCNGTQSAWSKTAGSVAYAANAGTANYATYAPGSTVRQIKDVVYSVNYSADSNAASIAGLYLDGTQWSKTISTFINATANTDGNVGLVPAPTTGKRTVAYVLTPTGWSNAASVRYASTANYSNNAGAIKDASTIDCGLVTS